MTSTTEVLAMSRVIEAPKQGEIEHVETFVPGY